MRAFPTWMDREDPGEKSVGFKPYSDHKLIGSEIVFPVQKSPLELAFPGVS
jgi:hypothetical protein